MPVDVLCEIDIDRPRGETAAYASDPDNATAWYENIKAVEWKTPRPLSVGSKIAFVANFLGRRLAYTMETTYTWEDLPRGRTRMAIRNRGEPAGFAKVGAPVMAAAMRRANNKDLRRLKEILERPPGADG